MRFVAHIPLGAALVLIMPLVAVHLATADQRTSGLIGKGTVFETRWHLYESDNEGPTVFITAGMHGNEPAGARAANQIARWTVAKGRLFVIPRCNEPALIAGTRLMPGLEGDAGNLNRHFPPIKLPARKKSEQAERIWKLVIEEDPDLLLDLHEGYGFHAAGSKSVGSSVIAYNAEVHSYQLAMLHAVNADINEDEKAFVPLGPAVAGSLVSAIADARDIEAYILETTTGDQPMSLRCRQHRTMVGTVLAELGMADESASWIVESSEDKQTVAVFDGPGSSSGGGLRLFEKLLNDMHVEPVGPYDIKEGALSQFKVAIFPGGSGSRQGESLGEDGRRSVRTYIQNGGAYIGICAGAYLALNNYSWGLKLLPLDSMDRKHWQRGTGIVSIEMSPEGRSLLGQHGTGELEIYFGQGPLMAPSIDSSLQEPEVLAWYRSGIGRNDADPETMVDTPAIVSGEYGLGRIVLFSPHPEKTAGIEGMVENAILWATDRMAVDAPVKQHILD